MSQRVSKLIKELSNDPSVKGVILYRVDGTPIYAEIKDERAVLIHLYFLEKHIKSLLDYIFNRKLEDVSIKVGNIKILLLPVTRTLVLSILFLPIAEYRLEIEAKRVINSLKPILLNEI
ncbi:hypothetical protein [Geoglobus acetivorans]|uniref:Roadblock/LAMTOR2 domain-containing protein n=1 Tax=Geoglobus acetivorans TaxID=565033 RepID=A0A0A7GGC1_GEOAI|nr:hypothetical protein GACE_0960 [Geoglobus acetivorans]